MASVTVRGRTRSAQYKHLFYLITMNLAFGAVLLLNPSKARGGQGFESCVINTERAANCWGFLPTGVPSIPNGVSQITTGIYHACALGSSGGVKCWGQNLFGEVGNGSNGPVNQPADVTGLTSGTAYVDGGGYYTCAVTTAGGLKCWGSNTFGRLGDGSGADSNVPVDVMGLTSGVAQVSTGYTSACALTTTGGVKCWDTNSFGQLGNATNINSGTPVDVFGLASGVAQISVGYSHACALTTSGSVKCWGGGSLAGQLGNGINANSNVPVDVTGLGSGVVQISAGDRHTCAVLAAGGARCWGENYYGSLGDGSGIGSNIPVAVAGLSSGVVQISSGVSHSCALLTTGGMKCWGYNSHGEVDMNTSGFPQGVLAPVDVPGVSSGVIRLWNGSPLPPIINDPPTVTITAPLSGTFYPAPAMINLTSTFTDSGAQDTHTCTVDWDDGSSPSPGIVEPGTCFSSHNYAQAGAYTITVRVTDNQGAFDEKHVSVIVYDVSAGFVTGGGWLVSPPTATGTTPAVGAVLEFELASRYNGKNVAPSGQLVVQISAANLRFTATEMKWLLITGTRAQIQGSGTINGTGNYGFLLTVSNTQGPGPATSGFGIKIWNVSTGSIVFNNAGNSDDIDTITPQQLGGGNIRIHN